MDLVRTFRRKQKQNPEFIKALIQQIWYACRGFKRLRKYGDWCYLPLPTKPSETSISADGESYDTPNNLLSDEEKDAVQAFINEHCGKPLEQVKNELRELFPDVSILDVGTREASMDKNKQRSKRDVTRFKTDLSECSDAEKDMLREGWALAWRHATQRAKSEFELYVRALLKISPQYPLEHLDHIKQAWTIALENGLLKTSRELEVYTLSIYHSLLWAKQHTDDEEVEWNEADRQRLDDEWELAAIRAMKLPADFNVYDALSVVAERKRRMEERRAEEERRKEDRILNKELANKILEQDGKDGKDGER